MALLVSVLLAVGLCEAHSKAPAQISLPIVLRVDKQLIENHALVLWTHTRNEGCQNIARQESSTLQVKKIGQGYLASRGRTSLFLHTQGRAMWEAIRVRASTQHFLLCVHSEGQYEGCEPQNELPLFYLNSSEVAICLGCQSGSEALGEVEDFLILFSQIRFFTISSALCDSIHLLMKDSKVTVVAGYHTVFIEVTVAPDTDLKPTLYLCLFEKDTSLVSGKEFSVNLDKGFAKCLDSAQIEAIDWSFLPPLVGVAIEEVTVCLQHSSGNKTEQEATTFAYVRVLPEGIFSSSPQGAKVASTQFRRLQATHYSSFKYTDDGTVSPRRYFLYNTHKSTQSISISASSASILTLFVYRNFAEGDTPGWADTQIGVCSVTLTSAVPADLEGKFMIELQPLSPVDLTVTITCSDASTACYCAEGEALNVGTGLCDPCPGAECQRLSTLTCLAVQRSPGAVLSCEHCGDGRYGLAATGACEACHQSCRRCAGSGSSDCVSCYSNASLAIPTAVSDCKCNLGYYPDSDASNCQVCDVMCSRCFGPSNTECDECSANASLAGAATCECNSGFAKAPSGCEACSGLCDTCEAAGANFCLTCISNAYRIDTLNPSACSCQVGFYQDTLSSCLACSPLCVQCVGGAATQCSLCHLNAHLSAPSSSDCVCDTSYFPDPDSSNCSPCHPTCLTCTSPGASGCSTCFADASVAASGACTCDSGTFPSPDSSQCSLCAAGCATCSSAADCDSCHSGAQLNALNDCVCSPGFTGSPESCSACHPTCLTCTAVGASFCDSCKLGAQLSGASPSSCVCMNGYYVDGADCKACNSQCLSCTGALQCTLCYSHAHVSAGSCICDNGYAPSPNAASCVPCHPTCKLCLSVGANGCSSCFLNASLSAAKACVCNVHFFPSSDSSNCTVCESSCNACSGPTSASCLTCFVNAGLDAAAPSSCSCTAGYAGSPEACQPCHPVCLTCSTTDDSHCESCKVNAYLVAGSPSACKCVDGMYMNTVAYVCSQCKSSCAKCSGASQNQCTECQAHAHLKDTAVPASSCDCDAGYFPSPTSANCALCDVTCFTCQSAGPTGCLSCFSSAAVNVSGECQCATSSYPNPDVRSCAPCSPTCYTCSGGLASQCLSCRSYASLAGSSPSSCQCVSGYFPNPTAAACKECHETCATCQAAASTQCLTCKAKASLAASPGPSSCVCNALYYPSPSSANCAVCSITCKTCSGELDSLCMSCLPGAALRDGVGPSPCQCLSGYYPASDASNCVLCHSSCSRCSGPGPSSCTSCKTTALLSGTSPSSCACKDGYYPNPDAGNCATCHITCMKCTGPSDSQCTDCPTNATLTSGVCVCSGPFVPTCSQCHETCLTCVGSGLAYCTSCYANAILRLPLSALYSSSVCVCADGYYAAPTVVNCIQCDSTCLSCNSGGLNGCTSCHPNAFLNGAGTCVCAAGFFPSPTAASCVSCDATCAQCQANDPLQCSGCFPHAHLQSGVPSQCVCDTGYYPATTARSCGICDPSCVACVGNEKSDCSQCGSNSHLIDDPNISACECVDGFYPNPHPGNCSLCHVYCKTCNGGTDLKCTSCFASATVSSGRCVCISAFFPSPDVRNCSPCYLTCANCAAADSGSCTACFAHASLVASAPAACQCDDTYLPSPTPATCIACHVECHSCVGTLQTDCDGCFPHASLASSPGKCVCDVGYFPDSTARLCSPCPEECTACVEINDCSQCYAHASLFVDASYSRLCRCDTHFFPSPSASNCQQCDLTCVECSGSAQACTACFSDSHLVSTQCACNSGLFRPASTSSCQPCHVSCQECQSTNDSTSCIQCKTNATLRTPPGPSDCLCVDQFFMVTGTCTACHATCFNCSSSGVASCTQCFAHASVASSGKCVCVDGYYPSPTASSCVLCSPLCLTCSAGGSGNCLSCHPHAALSSSPGLCACATGYWPNPDSASCAPCSITCLNCSGSTPADCIACKANAQLSSLPGNCECAPGFYLDNGNCLACDSACEECVGAGSSVCIVCKQYAKLASSAPANCICIDGYFPNPSPASCTGCAATCSLCVAGSSLDCTACHPHAGLSSSPGQCTCVDGYFPSPSSASCALCHSSCAKCSGASESDCLDCFLHAQLDTSTGKCVCEDGYWPSGNSANCQLCVNTCLKCSGGTSSKCTACKLHASLLPAAPPSTCVCATGFTQLQSTGDCQECDVSCSSCAGLQPSQCLTCFPNARLSGGLSPSMCECIEGFYPAGNVATCTACDHTCVQCAGGGPLQCLTCLTFAVLDTVPGPCRCTEDAFPSPDSSSCKLCAATCLSCISEKETGCLSCKSGAVLQGQKPSTCVCMPGFYGDASQCAPCASGCRTCRDAGECETCHAHASLQALTCECTAGYFGDPDQCIPCAAGCLSCVSTGCLKCAEGYYALAGECYASCPFGFKASDQQCVSVDLSPPVPSLTVNADNSLSVFFSKPMNCTVAAGDIAVEAADPSSRAIGVSWREPVVDSPQSISVALFFESEYVDAGSSVTLTFLAPQAVVDELGIPIEVTELTATLHPIGTSPANQTQVLLATPAAKTATAASRGGVSAGATVSLLNGNPAGLMTLVNQLQLITYLSMTKLPLPSDFASSLAALNVGNMIPNPALQYFTQNVSAQTPPKHVSDYGIESTLFLNNALTFLGTCVAVLSSYIPIYLLSKVRVPIVARYFAAMLPSFRWGVPLRLWLTSYLDLFVFSLLQLRNTSDFTSSGFTCVSVLMAAFCAFAAAVTPLLIVVFTYRNFNLLSSRADSGFNAHWGALYLSFKQTPYVSTVAYYSLFVIRRCLLAATLTLMDDQVEVLALINTSMSYLVNSRQFLLYIAVIRPFEVKIDQYEALVIEASTAIVYTEASACLLDLDEVTRSMLEKAGVWTVFIAIGLNVGISVIRSALVVKDMVRLYRDRMQVVKAKYHLEDVEVRSADRSTGNWLAL